MPPFRPNRLIGFLYAIGLTPSGQDGPPADDDGSQDGAPPGDAPPVRGGRRRLLRRLHAGDAADWFRNLVINPAVEVRVKSRRFKAEAEPITDPSRIADFLELRLRSHPRIVGKILQSEGLPAQPEREQLESYAEKIAVVKLAPMYESDGP